MFQFNVLKLSFYHKFSFVTFALDDPLEKSMTTTFGFLYSSMDSNHSDNRIDSMANLLSRYSTVLDIGSTI